MNPSLTREQFIDAIERGIRAAGDGLTNDQRSGLREVGFKATRAARVSFEKDGACCPLHCIGAIEATDPGDDRAHIALGAFFGAYDKATRDALGERARVFEVID